MAMGTLKTGRRRAWAIGIAAVAIATALGMATWLFGLASDRLAEARLAYARGEWDRAAEEARQRLHDGPAADREALRLYARASIRRGRDEIGNAIYRDRLGPEAMEAEDYYLVGLSMARLGRTDTAMQLWEKGAAIEGRESAELLEALARQSLASNRPEAADRWARRLARLPGAGANAWLLSGEARDRLDDPPGAAEALERGLSLASAGATAIDPAGLARARRLLARCRLRLGQPAAAREALRPILTPGPSPASADDREARWLSSRAALQEDRIDEATSEARQAGSYRHDNPLVPEPAPYVGSGRCVECHRAICESYAVTRHARSFHHGDGLAALPVPDAPLADPAAPGVTVTIRRDGHRIEVDTNAKNQVLKAIVAYAFGTPERYVTMIGRDDAGEFRGLRLSYYHNAHGSGWDRTAGDAGNADPHEPIRGRPIDVRDGVVRCLVCHVTRPRDFREPRPSDAGPEVTDRAIGCERCHGPGGNHLAAIAAGLADPAIAVARAAAQPAQTVDAQCAECHTVDLRPAIREAPDNPHFVRSPGFTLTFSRCYTESAGRLSCLSCHDPHRVVEQSAARYEERCLSCHGIGRPASTAPPGTAKAQACPVEPASGCVACHMPKVGVPELHTTLTDHFIRAHRRTAAGNP